jgi:hypothetical protein
MLRLTIVGDLQTVARRTLQDLGFTGPELESLYRLALTTFRRRVIPMLEQAYAADVQRAAARRGLQILVDVRAIRIRRAPSGELVEIQSSVEGPGADRIRISALEQTWNEQLALAFQSWIQENLDWILTVVRRNGGGQDSWFV